jgi:hypothetical protein
MTGNTAWKLSLRVGVVIALVFGVGHSIGHAQMRLAPDRPMGPTIEEYLEQVGPDGEVIEHGNLKIDGTPVNCGRRPTVINPNFDSWGGSFPGFVILNDRKIDGLPTVVKMYVYAHECGHQFVGADEVAADCFAVRRGVRWGWLNVDGMDEICGFISQLKGDRVHPPGPKRCEYMRQCYRDAVAGRTDRAASTLPD